MMFDPYSVESGSFVHKVIELYYQHYPPQELIAHTVIELYKNQSNCPILPEQKERRQLALTNFIHFEVERRKRDDTRPRSEWRIQMNTLDGIGEMAIIDYYNPVKKMPVDFKVSKSPSSAKKVQAAYYIYLLRIALKENNLTRFGFFFLLSNERKIIEVTDKMIEKTLQLRDKLLEAIKNRQFEPTKKCRYCDYRWYCPQGAYKQ